MNAVRQSLSSLGLSEQKVKKNKALVCPLHLHVLVLTGRPPLSLRTCCSHTTLKTLQGSYILDIKAETQRNHDLSQQLALLKAKLKEATSKHKQLQRDHARLLDRKLEGDRRMGSLQQKLQQLRTNKQAGGQSSSSAAAAAAAAAGPGQGFIGSGSSGGFPGSSSQAGFSGAASGAVAAEQQARLAAEAKVSWSVATHCEECAV